MVRSLSGYSNMFSKIFLVTLFASAFLVVCVSGEVIFADFTEGDLEGHMSWGQFMDNCAEGGTPYNSGGYFEDIEMHLIVDTDKETVTGSISGSGSLSNNINLYTQEYSFDGSISGTAKRTYWAGHMWEWVFEAEVELDLSFSTSYRCNTATPGEYNWISREETVHVTKMLRTWTAADNNQQFMDFRISWVDYDEQYETPIDFSLSHKNENEQRRAILPLEMPEPVDLSAEIIGPVVIGKSSSGERFSLDISGEQEEMVENVYWYFYNYDDLYGDYRWLQNFEQTSTDDLVIDSSVLSKWMERVDLLGESGPDGKSLRMQVYAEFEKGEYEWLAVTRRYNFTVTKGEVVTVSRFQVSGLGQPMKHVQILAESEAGNFITTTDDKGYFELPSTIIDQKEWELTIKFAYDVNGKEYFRMYSGSGEGLLLKFSIKDEKIQSANLENHIGSQIITLEVGATDPEAIILEKYLTPKTGLHTYISFYQHTAEALEFYIDYLGEEITYKLPLRIQAFYQPGKRIAYLFQEDKVGIVIHADSSKHDTPERPVNREYHEFSHYAMHSIYGFIPGTSTLAESTNHFGYLNPDTADSYSEGFAHFMSVIMNEYYSEKNGTPYDPDQCGVMASLEDNMKPWEKQGSGEEWSIAGILWDLYDTESHLTKSKTAQDVKLADNFDKMLLEADLNNNGKLELKELLYHTKNPIMHRTGIYITSYSEYDENMDEKFDKDELEYMFRLDDEGLEPFLSKADQNKNGEVDYDELFVYIGAQEEERFAKQFTGNELDANIEDMKTNGFPAEFDKEGWIRNNNEQQKVDDTVSLSLNEIWSILRTPKNNFYEVYQAFIAKYPNQKTEIDKIFQAHGFWQDKNPGNGKLDENEPYKDTNKNEEYDEGEPFVDYPVDGFKYDVGEIIGPAANYNRQERRSTLELPGQKVKVDNAVPFYSIKVEYYSNGVNSSLVPNRILEYEVENKEGYIYIPFPPEAYEATLSIEPVDVEFTRGLQISSKEFHQNYTLYVEQGFYVEHDFNVIGLIPDPPVNPYYVDFSSEEQPPTDSTETETETPDEPESPGGGIPSFPIVSMILGVSLLLLFYRNRI